MTTDKVTRPAADSGNTVDVIGNAEITAVRVDVFGWNGFDDNLAAGWCAGRC